MKEEIIGGLRNALERGESIEKAMQTFINAGYSSIEVREAAGMINPSAANVLYGNQSMTSLPTTASAPTQFAAAKPMATTPSASQSKPTSQQFPSQVLSQTAQVAPLTTVMPAIVAGAQASQAKGKKTALILAVILIILVILLVITFLYSNNIIALFSS